MTHTTRPEEHNQERQGWRGWHGWEHLTSAVVLSALVFTFLAIFFYTYVIYVERDVFDKELVNTFDSLSVDPKTVRFVLASIPDSPDSVNNQPEIDAWKQRNDTIQFDSWYVAAMVFGICLIFSIAMSFIFHFSIFQLWIRAIVYLTFIGLTEFMFLALVTRQYSTVSPVQVKRIISTKVKEYK